MAPPPHQASPYSFERPIIATNIAVWTWIRRRAMLAAIDGCGTASSRTLRSETQRSSDRLTGTRPTAR